MFLHIGARRSWRPRSSWKLLSSHPACRAIQALKEPSELLKRAEEGWEFLSQWKLLEDINFYYHFVFATVYSHGLVCTRFTWVVHTFVSQRWKYKRNVVVVVVVYLQIFWRCFSWQTRVKMMLIPETRGRDRRVVWVCVWSASLCLRRLSVYSVLGEMDPVEHLLDLLPKFQNPAWV